MLTEWLHVLLIGDDQRQFVPAGFVGWQPSSVPLPNWLPLLCFLRLLVHLPHCDGPADYQLQVVLVGVFFFNLPVWIQYVIVPSLTPSFLAIELTLLPSFNCACTRSST